MPKPKKRKSDSGDGSEELQKRPALLCILHANDIKYGDFICLNNIQGSVVDRLSQLHDIRDRRLNEPQDSPNRMEDVCQNIPESLENVDLEKVGYHRGCYQAFTKNRDRLTLSDIEPNGPSTSRSPRRSSNSSLFPPECIFCGKFEVKASGKTERCTTFPLFKDEDGILKQPSWKQIAPRALELGNSSLHRMVQDEDLFAREAKFHQSCRKSFNLNYTNYLRDTARARTTSILTKQDHKAAAHRTAFAAVLDSIQNQVIRQNQIVPLATLRLLYLKELEDQGYPSPEYRGEKLKSRLENHDICNSIAFTKVSPGDKGCITYNLVYSASISVEDAVTDAYKLGSKVCKYQDVALLLRRTIQGSFNSSQPLPWPPTADHLEFKLSNELLPHELVKFLNFVISGDADAETSDKTRRIVQSIGQDICRAATNGEWKLPKHILLCTTIRHLFRSKKLTTILSRLGHCETYDFGLELETALATALDEVSTSLTPQIITGDGNSVFHLEWDNMNKITTNVHGSNVVNSAGGIMIQNVKPGFDETNRERTLPLYKRNKTRSLKLDTPETLTPVHIYSRVGPKFAEGAVFTPPIENSEMLTKCMKEFHIWTIARVIGSSGLRQLVPGFGGFISATGIMPPRTSTIDYFTPINQPFTDYAVIKELLRRSEDATLEVGQEYVLNTFDLGGCMKALPLIWKFPDEYRRHVVTPGAFHTGMNYMGMVTGHKCRGSGYAEILVEAGLITGGCLTGVLSGRAYAKALFCLKTVSEAMGRLMVERFVEDEEVEVANPVALLNLIQTCTRENLDLALKDHSTIAIIDQYLDYEGKVRTGYLGKTAMFWLSVMDHSRLILMLQYAVKTNNFALFHKCNGDMADLFFAYDGPNYSRYLVWFEAFLTNIDLSHPGAKELLTNGGIAVARSLIPGALSAVDKTMEETFMKFAKSTGGFVGIFSMFGAYQRWCRTTSTRAQYYEKMLEMCGLIDDPDCPKAGKHRELERAEIQRSEDAVQRTVATIRNFTNPFTLVDKDHLYSLASGAPASLEVELDVLNAEAIGKAVKEGFIKDRFVNGSSEEQFFEPIKRLKLKTMEASNKVVKLTVSQGKVIQYRAQSDLALTLLIKSQRLDKPINLDELMRYSLTPVPYSLGTPDGFFNKTNKAAMLHFLTEDAAGDEPFPNDALHIQDGNALLHSLTNLPPTFGEICLQVLDQMVAKKNFVFSTDSYHADSVKAQERLRRGFSQRYIIDGPATRKPNDFKLFLSNEENKKQLCRLLLQVWSSNAAALRLTKAGLAIVVVDGKAHQLESSNGNVTVREIHELLSNQEETDTRVVLYLKYAVTMGYHSAVVRTPDTDIFLILLHHASTITLTTYLDIGSGKHRQLVNVSEMAESKGPDYCTALLGLYVFTGEDVTSAFKGKGKLGPLKKLQSNPKYHSTFRNLGDDWSVMPAAIDDIEAFTCLMYGYAREKSINAVRSVMLKKMVGVDDQLMTKSTVDLSRLPPCRDNLIPHIERVNHRLATYKRADVPIFWRPKPFESGQGWEKTEDGVLEPVWSKGPVLPSSLIDMIEETVADDEEEDNAAIDYDDVFDGDY